MGHWGNNCRFSGKVLFSMLNIDLDEERAWLVKRVMDTKLTGLIQTMDDRIWVSVYLGPFK